ncbi:MAG: c-type cytochrome [Verrucomicrobiota bacterium]
MQRIKLPAPQLPIHFLPFLMAITLATTALLTAQEALLPPEQAAASMQVPEGFSVSLFAGEPDLKQPIAFCIDDRGRLWVAEANNYPDKKAGLNDRILIYEDSDNDGRFDKKTVFYDQLEYVTGIEVGFGGAWVMSPPNFYFIPDRNGDDIPDGKPEILLDGFGTAFNAHNIANGFSWGPDGWLYGCHGRTNWSLPGKPGTPEKDRTRFDGGIYRYHPTRHVWEPFSDGTTNPWGIDFNDYGQAFTCNCVNPHLFHMIQGAHYDPWRNRESSQFAYQRIQSIADHLHYAGSSHTLNRGTRTELEVGGGHAHCGTMIYLGGSWPKKYRNTVFMNNTHGRRMNNDILRRQGSGYTASHGGNLLVSQDPWFMGVTIRYGPDGSAFVSDWSDTGECHSIKDTRKNTGRLYKITYGEKQAPSEDLSQKSNSDLVSLQSHQNDWWVQHARRLLQERAATGQDMQSVHLQLRELLNQNPDPTRQLRALWALHVTGGADPTLLTDLLDHNNEYVKAWAIQLLNEKSTAPAKALSKFASLAASDPSPLVRLYLSSALQRLPAEQRWPIIAALAAHGEDADDANLPLMLWYGTEPLIHNDPARFIQIIKQARIPLIRRHIARRASSQIPVKAKSALNELLVLLKSSDTNTRIDILTGINEGLVGRSQVPMPSEWSGIYPGLSNSKSSPLREQATLLALTFGDGAALSNLRKLAADTAADENIRRRTIEALVKNKDEKLPQLLITLLKDPATRQSAVKGLAKYDHPQTVTSIIAAYPGFDPACKQDAVQTLASRPQWAEQLLQQIQQQQIPKTDIPAFTLRQMAGFKKAPIDQAIKKIWGQVRPTAKDKARLIARFKKQFTPAVIEKADPANGRLMFQRNCMACHQLFGEGTEIGPDLTGSDRRNLDYVLENVIDPNAFAAKDYQITTIESKDGRLITGMIKSETPNAVAIQTLNEELIIAPSEIKSRNASPLSMMPEGLVTTMSNEQFRDLISYLASDHQAPTK